MKDNESLIIDYAKSIGIILVVMYHLKTGFFNVYHAYMYHMPLFFFIGGILYKDRPFITTVVNSTKKQFFYLVYTFIILAIIGMLIESIFGIKNGNVYTGNLLDSIALAFKSNLSNNKLFIVAWFLLAYWLVSIAFSAAYKILSLVKNTALNRALIILVGLALGYVAVNVFADSYHLDKKIAKLILSQVCFGLMFYCAGFSLRNYIFDNLNIYSFIIITALLLVLRNYGLATSTGMSWAAYKDGFYVSTFTAFAGIYAVMFISKLLALQGEMKLFREIGKSSRDIMSYHILSFVILDIIFSYTLSYKIQGTDAYSNHFYDKWTWPVYSAVGVLLPTAVSYTYRAAKSYVLKSLTR
ncbi:TPA: acyltransferase family protein [Citrobacter koseri]|uniref:acyltransferase family protein n=1 Tax=Citrobacter TaxID=544 RepID=UPI000E02CE84|nr:MULTISPECIES: acyltransferase family protein [Citrobacter]MDE9578484.1 acyltransferase family protein [Citrobacter koseri]MDM3025027.1 acyltransferase family protein [Citrobacter sp. CK194]WEE15617.1 acyltransferase family protein [Citrobacter koseri]STA78472.1 Fucose 4-O-acetylase and related acetyltransferases [Citrobacter koseri]STT22041.1 Fucose 4-O-acetylase and related acetyltransferases [Citrobacter koseri]